MNDRVCAGSVAELHALPMPTHDQPTAGNQPELWLMRPTGAAVAMGSAQKPEDFDSDVVAARALALAPRRSGGGAVFIEPEQTVWIDLVAPRTSQWWSDELAENFMIVGRVWQQALASLGVQTTICAEAPQKSDASRAACWAGIGWGELTIEDSKVVGLSQRRTRWGVRVQAMAVLDASSAQVADVLPQRVRAAARAAIGTRHAAVLADNGVTRPRLEAAVLSAFSVA